MYIDTAAQMLLFKVLHLPRHSLSPLVAQEARLLQINPKVMPNSKQNSRAHEKCMHAFIPLHIPTLSCEASKFLTQAPRKRLITVARTPSVFKLFLAVSEGNNTLWLFFCKLCHTNECTGKLRLKVPWSNLTNCILCLVEVECVYNSWPVLSVRIETARKSVL